MPDLSFLMHNQPALCPKFLIYRFRCRVYEHNQVELSRAIRIGHPIALSVRHVIKFLFQINPELVVTTMDPQHRSCRALHPRFLRFWIQRQSPTCRAWSPKLTPLCTSTTAKVVRAWNRHWHTINRFEQRSKANCERAASLRITVGWIFWDPGCTGVGQDTSNGQLINVYMCCYGNCINIVTDIFYHSAFTDNDSSTSKAGFTMYMNWLRTMTAP